MSSQLIEWKSTNLVALGEEMQQRVAKVQDQFDQRARTARNEAERERLRVRLESLVDGIQHSYGERVKQMVTEEDAAGTRGLYDTALAGIDMGELVYQGDRESLGALLADADFSGAVNRVLATHEPYNARKELLSQGLRLSRATAPAVYRVIDYCVAVLKLHAEIEVYVYQDFNYNAACYPPVKDKVLLMVTSSLLERFTQRELAFVFGHEIGHYLFEHTRFPVSVILQNSDGNLSPVQAMKLFAWIRAAEITADRVGLVCCRDFRAAANAFFKLSSGLTGSVVEFNVDSYIEQLKELREELEADSGSAEDWYSTHPFNPLRVQALSIFARTKVFHRLVGSEGGNLEREQMAAQIKALMAIMEPTYLQDTGDTGRRAQTYILLAGYLVAAANGVVEPSEVQAIATLVGPRVSNEQIRKVLSMSIEAARDQVQKLSQDLSQLLKGNDRLKLLRDMAIIALSDGSVDKSEVACLYWLSENLKVDPSFIDMVLTTAIRGID